jgi:hypothetical protein
MGRAFKLGNGLESEGRNGFELRTKLREWVRAGKRNIDLEKSRGGIQGVDLAEWRGEEEL